VLEAEYKKNTQTRIDKTRKSNEEIGLQRVTDTKSNTWFL